MFKELVLSFWQDESGMVTVDWVVLSSTVLVGVAALLTPLSEGVSKGGSDIASAMSAVIDEDVNSPMNGNPGNDRNKGGAGENPNGAGGWGNGDKGKSE